MSRQFLHICVLQGPLSHRVVATVDVQYFVVVVLVVTDAVTVVVYASAVTVTVEPEIQFVVAVYSVLTSLKAVL